MPLLLGLTKICAPVMNGIIAPCIGEACAPYTYALQLQKLNQLTEKLTAAKSKLAELVGETDGTAVPNNDAIEWRKEAEVTLEEVDQNIKRLERDMEATCACCLPNCRRRRAAKKAIQGELEKVDKLMRKYMPLVKGYEWSRDDIVLNTRKDDIEMIWKFISERDDIKVICIHGIAYVGKTEVAKAVCNKALQDKHEKFGYVVWVDASYNMILKSLQEKIMKTFKIEIADTDDDKDRAIKIRNEFVRRKKCLVIVDSLWENFSLEDIGIPEKEEGVLCKVILTSRSKFMCGRIPKDEYIEIKPLSEGWNFFQGTLKYDLSSLDDEVKNLVMKAVEACAGLPGEIIVLGHLIRELHGQSSNEMVSALEKILSSRTTSEPSTNTYRLRVLKHSYKKLGETAQLCFLYCALYPKGLPIEADQLIDNWIWDGLLERFIGTLQEKRKHGRTVLTTLKSARLLEKADSDGGTREAVKMLGLFHDMAVYILFKRDLGVFINAGNDVIDFPATDGLNDKIQKASLMYNKLRVLKNQPNCPALSTLLLQNNPLNFCSDSFFTKIPNLKLLDMSDTNISDLPSSICNLKFLRVLRLRNCHNMRFLPRLSNLEELIVLDLFGTPLKELPLGMEKMKKLKRLDLSYTKLAKFQAGLVSALDSLEELLLIINDAEAYSWRSKQTRSSAKEAYIEELACLDGLRILQVNFFNQETYKEYVKAIPNAMPPPRFKFCVGGFNTNGNLGENSIAFIDGYPVDQQLPEGTMELYLSMCRSNLSPNNTLENSGIKFQNLKVLSLFDCCGLTYLFSFEMLQCLQNLEKIYVRQCWSIVGIIKPAEKSNTDNPHAVPSCRLLKIQELVLINLPKLKSICPDQQELDWPAFRRFSVWNCKKLKTLPLVVSKATTMIKLRGRSFKLDDSHNFEREEADMPENIVSFVSMEKPELSPQPMVEDEEDQARFFRRKATEKSRTAAILSENDGNATPPSPQSPGYIVRRLDSASTLLRVLQKRIGVVFIN
ncbi:probable disease resistance protein At4g27220 isoform X1 [Beta vulgaris subsp. vulgaris]|nr:probable disease resistance protein At4g27220 isoform X1 [Beta vulgaris subsp. vulgaris]